MRTLPTTPRQAQAPSMECLRDKDGDISLSFIAELATGNVAGPEQPTLLAGRRGALARCDPDTRRRRHLRAVGCAAKLRATRSRRPFDRVLKRLPTARLHRKRAGPRWT